MTMLFIAIGTLAFGATTMRFAARVTARRKPAVNGNWR
jgi:hypothetical protein